MLTACGIETRKIKLFVESDEDSCNSAYRLRYWNWENIGSEEEPVSYGCNSAYRLRYWNLVDDHRWIAYYTVATVLTACGIETGKNGVRDTKPTHVSCNSAYRLRYWNITTSKFGGIVQWNGCNSAYRLRYWNAFFTSSLRLATKVATVLTACGIETAPVQL